MQLRHYHSAVAIFAVAAVLLISGAAVSQETVLYPFTGEKDGGSPHAGLVLGHAGNLYGTAPMGGVGYGVVFELTHSSSGWHEEILYSFKGGKDGGLPSGGLVLDLAGNLYGTTSVGGDTRNCSSGCGVVFELTHATGSWKEHVLYSFSGGKDGAVPYPGVIRDSAGTLYGIAGQGGIGQCPSGCGVVYELNSIGGKWRERTLYSFTGGNDGGNPNGSLAFDFSHNLYGIAAGGTSGQGLIFEVRHSPKGWKESTLYSFPGGEQGSYPTGGVVIDKAGNLYGTTNLGSNYGYGTVYQLAKMNGTWTETVLHGFGGSGDGTEPEAGVIFDAAGNLYGTTGAGGASGGGGIVFKLVANHDGTWTENILYSFTGEDDGRTPWDNVVLDRAGNAYGTTYGGGLYQAGVIFEVR